MTDDSLMYYRLGLTGEPEPCTMREQVDEHRKRTIMIRQMGEDNDPWRVRVTYTGDDSHVSTVFLGVAHGFSPQSNKPYLFETLVFGGPLDGEQVRYVSRKAAVSGHHRMVERIWEINRQEEVTEDRRKPTPDNVVSLTSRRKIRIRKDDK